MKKMSDGCTATPSKRVRKTPIKTFVFSGASPRPRVAMMGAVHGNEVCGTKALRRLAREIGKGNLNLRRGELVLIPVANPQAYQQNIRYVEKNLNRVFCAHDDPHLYEHHVANQLSVILKSCDVLIDFHSIHSKGDPFVMRFNDATPADVALEEALGLPAVVEGWAEAYASSLPDVDMGHDAHSVAFIRRQGGIGAGVECGQHDDPRAIDMAYEVAVRALIHLGLVDGILPPPPSAKRFFIETVVFSTTGKETFERVFAHGDALKAGDLIGHKQDGSDVRAPKDCLILFPRPRCPAGEEWYYLGQSL